MFHLTARGENMSLLGDFFSGIGILGQAKEANEQNKLLQQQQYLDSIQQSKENELANQQFDWNMRVAEQNYNLQKDQFEYQKELNNLAMQREDTAYSRAVEDLKNAGLSPLMLSSGAGAQALTSASAPQMDASGVNQAYSAKQDYYARLRQARQYYTEKKFILHQQNRQMSLQNAQLALQVENQYFDNQLKKGQIERQEHENKYYREHGYRETTLASVLSDFLNRESTKNLLDKAGSTYDKVADSIGRLADSISGKDWHVNINNFESTLKENGLNDEEIEILSSAAKEAYNKPLWKITNCKTSLDIIIG